MRSLDDAESLLDTTDIEDELKRELYGSLASMRCFQFYAESDGERCRSSRTTEHSNCLPRTTWQSAASR